MLRDDGAVGAGHLCAAEDRAQVLWVHDPVQRHQQRRVGGKELLQGPNTPGLELGRDALVHAGGHRLEPFWRHDLDWRQLGQLVEARIVAETRSLEHFQNLAGAGRLEHRVATMDQSGRSRGRALVPLSPIAHVGGTRRHRTPCLESSNAMPRCLSSSRI